MNTQQFNLVFISDDVTRTQQYSAILNDPQNRIRTYSFHEAFTLFSLEKPFDLILIDYASSPDFDIKRIQDSRVHLRLENMPFIYILKEEQIALKKQLYKDPRNKILIEPIDKFAFISTLSSAIHLSHLERRLSLYQEIIEGEKKLISSMDDLLGMDEILSFGNEQDLLHHLELDFVRRLELALAVETALFAYYDDARQVLNINLFDSSGEQLVRKHFFSVQNSIAGKLLVENFSQIFENGQLLDPFIQEVEEALHVKIFSLLFIPISVFHRPRAAILLVNKLYRDAFTENDLSFSLIAAQKITYHLEKLNMEASEAPDNRAILKDRQLSQLKLFRQIMQSVHFGTIVFDEKLRIVFINEAAREILNYQKEKAPDELGELFGKADVMVIHKQITQGSLPLVRQELHVKRDDQPHFYIGYSVYPFMDDFRQKNYIFVFSEISQTKRIQAEIIRMDRMASLGVLSSGIAHEIRNPLAGIKAMTQTLEEELEEDSLQQEYVKRILRQVDRLDDLLKAFFSYARPSRPDPTTQHIRTIIDEVIPLVRPKTQEKRITIELDYADNLAMVFVDANQIQQIFLNLFLNAIDAMPEGGAINISAHNAGHSQPLIDRRKSVPGLLSDTFVQISFKDTGKGISPAVLEQIFNPFYTTKANGTGLGLSIVYQIIREHGGRIDVQSEEGKGTEFVILLPAVEKEIRK